MEIAIVGAGALGAVMGGLLHEANLNPTLLERNPQEVDFITTHGLWIEGVSGDRFVQPKILLSDSALIQADIVLVLVKSYDTKAAVETVSRILRDDGLVLTLQNGIGNFEILEKAFPGRVLLGTTTIGALALGLGRVRHTGFGQTHLGEIDGSIRERTVRVARVLEAMNAGPVHLVENAVGCVWSKLIINAAINAAATLLRVRNGDLADSDAGRILIHEIVEECRTIVRAKGIRLIFDDPEEQVLAVCRGTAGNLNSMFQDMRAGRRTEIDFINGALAREGDALGVPAPVNKTLTLLIKAMEATREKTVTH